MVTVAALTSVPKATASEATIRIFDIFIVFFLPFNHTTHLPQKIKGWI
jgi:hypothetical protein